MSQRCEYDQAIGVGYCYWRDEVVERLEREKAALLEALEATEELIGNLAEGWSKSEDAGVHISTSADLDYMRSLIRRYRRDAKPLADKARAAIALAEGETA